MKVLFVSSGNSKDFDIIPFIKNQGESLRSEGIELDFYSIKGKGIAGYFKAILPLKKHIKAGGYDLIHAHFIYSGWTAVLASLLTGKPVVVSFMGNDLCGEFKVNGSLKPKSYLYFLLSFLIQPSCKAIIVKSQNLLDRVWMKDKTFKIPNGIDFKQFRPIIRTEARARLNLPMDQKIVLFMGSKNQEVKNYSGVKKAFDLLNDSSYQFINPYPVKHNDVPLFLSACDVLVVPSFNEGSANIIKEALACNTKIVATPVGDAVEMIGQQQGCFITGFDAEEMASKIKSALNYDGQMNGRDSIQHLEIGATARTIIDIYNQ
ncbi:MAG: teichuronic acid biosynthesis glycosyltransferase TuaC [Granulosicoccus sp.]|jgi:teichuronic acid biosynthesis glycosyltransferase TuaC